MKPNIKIYITFLLLLIAHISPGQVLTLDSVLAMVRENNPMLQQYDERAKAMNAYTQGAASWMAPMVGGGTFMTAYPGSENVTEGDKGMAMISAQQDIPNPAKLKAKKAFYNSKAAIEESGKDISFNELQAEAKKLYYQWKVLEKKKAVLQENESIMLLMKKLADIRYPYSQGSLSNIYKAEGRLHEVRNMILMTESEIEQKNILLNTLMNIPRNTRFQIDTAKVEIQALLTQPDSTTLLTSRSDIRNLENQISSMRLNSKLMSYDAKPDFSIRYEHMSPWGRMMPNQFTVMGMVSIPIAPWSSKGYKSQVKGMNLEIKAMEKEKEAIISQSLGTISNMNLEIKTRQLQLVNYETKIIPALRRNYNTVMLAYEENKGEFPIVVDAWEALNMSQMEYLNNLEQLYLMIVNYEKELEK